MKLLMLRKDIISNIEHTELADLIICVTKWISLLSQREPFKNEAEFRDDLYRSLFLSGFSVSREEYSVKGDSDILAIYELRGSVGKIKVRVPIEIKIWGRNDYKKIPTKPLKYLNYGEIFGIYIMVCPKGLERIENKIVNFARSNSSFRSVSIIDRPLASEGLPFHFLSTHFDKEQVEMKNVFCFIARAGVTS
jgi:hypothetical protein